MKKLFTLIFTASISQYTLAETLSFNSGESQNTLIELYTSEGCSSCPPADKFLSDYVKSKDLWTQYIPLAFHVDYWDYLGWKDVFASADFSFSGRGALFLSLMANPVN